MCALWICCANHLAKRFQIFHRLFSLLYSCYSYAYKSSSIWAAWKHRHMTRCGVTRKSRTRERARTKWTKKKENKKGEAKMLARLLDWKSCAGAQKAKLLKITSQISWVRYIKYLVSFVRSFGKSQSATTKLPPRHKYRHIFCLYIQCIFTTNKNSTTHFHLCDT